MQPVDRTAAAGAGLGRNSGPRVADLDRNLVFALDDRDRRGPTAVLAVAGLDIAARYVPGTDVGVGGDWYDLFALPSGHIGVAIGDVAGSGLRAAVVMGRIRSALRAYALETTDPADVLSRLDRKIQLFEPDAMATAIYAVIGPDLTTVTLSCAGHLPPALVTPSQASRLLVVKADLPLGAYPDAYRHNTHTTLDPGGCLLFYTDGLVERRDQTLDAGMNLLLDALTCETADAVCATVMSALLHGMAATDDTAILALRKNDD